MAKLLSINTSEIQVKKLGKFIDLIQIPGIFICSVDWSKSEDNSCVILFNDKNPVKVVQSQNPQKGVCLEIEVEDMDDFKEILDTNKIKYSGSSEIIFKIQNVQFKAKENPNPLLVEFEFDSTSYSMNKKAINIAKTTARIQLPDGRLLRVHEWSRDEPNKPTRLTILEVAQAKIVPEKTENNDNSIFNESVTKMQNAVAKEELTIRQITQTRTGHIFNLSED